MSPRALQLRHRAASVRATVAWFIPGGEPAEWLAEFGRWTIPQESLRLFVVPRSVVERTAAGLLVLMGEGSAMPQGARGLPLGAIEGRLFLPIDAELVPPVTAAEVRTLCPAAVTFFHPGLGAIEFAATDCRRVWDLLERPATNDSAHWNSAVAAALLSSRLAGVTLRALPQSDELFGQASREIGSEPVLELPPSPHEPRSSPAGRIVRALTGWSAVAIAKIFSLIPKTSLRRTWVNDVMDWASSKLAGVSKEMEQLRHRELHRLMHLLESDPERGLRHALPLGGTPGRGRVVPGSKLGTHDLRFDLARMRGGRATDHWDVPPELRRKLTDRYRELALREQRLGRFQRAAYIHAELLGDLSAAAAVLKEGRLFAEAAVLYRDHLRQTRAAAECLVAGGLFTEAIAIFEKEGAFLEIGDLHRRLGNEPGATLAFRSAVEVKIAAHDLTAAAVLLEERLRLPDEALALLRKGWPHSPQARQCLAAELALLGRLGRHDATLRRVGELAEEATPPSQLLDLAEILKSVSRTYPDRSLRPVAADLARVKVSRRLDSAEAGDMRRGVGILHELAPDDRLLARDCSRFVARRTASFAQQTAPLPRPHKPGSAPIAAPQLQGTFKLPRITIVDAVKRCGRTFVAVVRQDGKFQFMRGDWGGIVNAVPWAGGRAGPERVSLVLDNHDGNPKQVVPFTFPLPDHTPHVLPTTTRFPDPLTIAVPSWMPGWVAAISISGAQWWLLRGSASDLILEVRSKDGSLTGSRALTPWIADIDGPVENISLLALKLHAWVALGRRLLLFNGTGDPRQWDCESVIVGLEPSAPFLPCAVVARCDRGAAVFWHDAPGAAGEMLATDLVAPYATFLSNGTLVLLSSVAGADGFAGKVFDLDRRGVQSTADFAWSGAWPVALVATNTPDGFAIFTTAGEVHLHRVPVVAK